MKRQDLGYKKILRLNHCGSLRELSFLLHLLIDLADFGLLDRCQHLPSLSDGLSILMCLAMSIEVGGF